MVDVRLDTDRIFFDEWTRLHRVSSRSISRVAALAEVLGLPLHDIPAIVIVGSKGKATAATFASAALASFGFRVGTITSPPVITNRERIRLAGVAIDESAYSTIAKSVAGALRSLPPATEQSGYASPVGLYMVAGLDYLRLAGCDAFVVEAGMGGRSDEVSLLTPSVVGVTAIFAEHLPLLGKTVGAVAEEKLGVIKPATRAVFSVSQSPEVMAAFRRLDIDARFLAGGELDAGPVAQGHMMLNANLGLAAGEAFASLAGRPRRHSLPAILETVRLPGRLTRAVDARATQWLVDAAIDVHGMALAFSQAIEPVDLVLVSLPDSKNIEPVVAWLNETMGSRWIPVVPHLADHLSYSAERWGRPLIPWTDVVPLLGASKRIVAVGSWSFMSSVLGYLGLENERSFTCP